MRACRILVPGVSKGLFGRFKINWMLGHAICLKMPAGSNLEPQDSARPHCLDPETRYLHVITTVESGRGLAPHDVNAQYFFITSKLDIERATGSGESRCTTRTTGKEVHPCVQSPRSLRGTRGRGEGWCYAHLWESCCLRTHTRWSMCAAWPLPSAPPFRPKILKLNHLIATRFDCVSLHAQGNILQIYIFHSTPYGRRVFIISKWKKYSVYLQTS